MIDYGKRNVLGVSIDAVDVAAATERIMHFARHRRPLTVTALAVHGVIESTQDATLREDLDEFDLVLPDGQPVRWAVNFLYGLDLPEKVPGPTVVDCVLEQCAAEGLRVYFYGSTPETLEKMAHELEARFDGRLDVVMEPSRFGAVDEDELSEIARRVNDSGAHVCFVGLGCPRQERFVAAVGRQFDMPSLAVGAAFDYIAGNIHRAPEQLQRAGLEWFYRVMQEPGRLAGRYLSTNTRFIVGGAQQAAVQLGARLLPADVLAGARAGLQTVAPPRRPRGLVDA